MSGWKRKRTLYLSDAPYIQPVFVIFLIRSIFSSLYWNNPAASVQKLLHISTSLPRNEVWQETERRELWAWKCKSIYIRASFTYKSRQMRAWSLCTVYIYANTDVHSKPCYAFTPNKFTPTNRKTTVETELQAEWNRSKLLLLDRFWNQTPGQQGAVRKWLNAPLIWICNIIHEPWTHKVSPGRFLPSHNVRDAADASLCLRILGLWWLCRESPAAGAADVAQLLNLHLTRTTSYKSDGRPGL